MFGNSITTHAKLMITDSLRAILNWVSIPQLGHCPISVKLTFPQLWHLLKIVYPHFEQMLVLFRVLQTGQVNCKTFLQLGHIFVSGVIS